MRGRYAGRWRGRKQGMGYRRPAGLIRAPAGRQRGVEAVPAGFRIGGFRVGLSRFRFSGAGGLGQLGGELAKLPGGKGPGKAKRQHGNPAI